MLVRQTPLSVYTEVVGEHLGSIDALEIHGIRSLSDAGDYEVQEIDDENPHFYSVYIHLNDGGVDCIGDFPTLEDARFYAELLSARHGWPIQ